MQYAYSLCTNQYFLSHNRKKMKKIYSLMLALAAAAVTPAAAETVTLIVDNPEAIRITRYDYNVGSEVDVVSPIEAVNQIEYNITDYWSITIKPQDGFKLDKVLLDGNDKLYGNSMFYLYLDASQADVVYNVTTKNLAESRNSTATLTVDDASKVQLTRGDYSEVTLSNGTNIVKFDAATETPFMLRSTNGGDLFSVTHNGNSLTPQYGWYKLYVEDGSEIDIKADFPDETHLVKMTVPEGCEDFVSSVVDANYQNIEGDILAGISMKAGTKFTVNFNTASYAIDKFSVNGKQMTDIYSSYTTTVTSEDLLMQAEVHPYGSFDVVFNVDDPTRLQMFEGYNSYGTAYNLVAGDNTFSFQESQYSTPQVYMQPTAGNIIQSVTRYNGDNEPEVIEYFPMNVYKGDRIEIVTAEKVRDQAILLWIDPQAYDNISAIRFQNYNEAIANGPYEAGTNEVKFASADMPFNMYIDVRHPDPIPDNYQPWQPVVFLNDLSLSGTTSFYFTNDPAGEIYLASGDMLRIFKDTPVMHIVNVTFADGTPAENFEISADTQAVEDWAEAGLFTAYERSTISVKWNKPADEEGFYFVHSCNLDGTDLTPDENGVCTFAVSGDHTLLLTQTKNSGIDNVVSAEGTADNAIYNLQGIKVADSAAELDRLPAGIYVCGGKKIAVK